MGTRDTRPMHQEAKFEDVEKHMRDLSDRLLQELVLDPAGEPLLSLEAGRTRLVKASFCTSVMKLRPTRCS